MKKTLFLLCTLIGLSTFSQNITLESVASGFNQPLNIQHANDDRLFIVEKGGRIKIINSDGSVNAENFLDISGQISTDSERGLLGLAFHPDYVNNGYFYVYYSKVNGDSQISRYSVDANNPDLADPTSELFLLDIQQPFSNHNGGCMAFGPEGYLYIGTGDGGSAGDPGNRAQNTTLLLGKMLRIDVDNPGGGENYGIPADNPFAGSSLDAEEIWAYGLRNPWKFSFDSVTGDLWIADVGQNAIEEINKAAHTEAGLNYGWRCYEGSQAYNTTDCPDPSELTFPIAEYVHPIGFSITGGYVYRGPTYNNMAGYYFFADFSSGILGTVDSNSELTNLGNFGQNWSSFGEDVNGELYLSAFNGVVYKIVGEILSNNDFELPKINLYPNPAQSEIYVRTEGHSIDKIELFDLQGAMMDHRTFENQAEVKMSTLGLSSGVYLIRIYTSEGTMTTKKLVVN
jgi:glucose/arabinose dehydrogenase